MIKAVVAVDANWSIGKDNDLLFYLKKDLNYFKILTNNKIVFCGRKTLESFPGNKPLKGRSTICLCSKKHYRNDCFCVDNLETAIKLLQELGKTQEVWIIGGATIYEALLPFCEEVYVTKIAADGNGTVFFPNLAKRKDFACINETAPIEDNGHTIKFCIYKRVK